MSGYTKSLSKLIGIGYLDALAKRKKMRDELHALLQDSDNDSEIRLGHRRIIRKILDFSQKTVKQVMIPLVNVDAIPDSYSIEDAIEQFEKLRHSRLPVYSERIDNIIGILDFKDIFYAENSSDKCVKYMRNALFVPEHQLLESLTTEMRSKNALIAIVVDEYGGAVGIVSKEDVLEEIVGNISDEYDEHQLTYRKIDDNIYLAHASMDINEVNERFHLHIPKGEYETLSGFLLQQFNRIPEAGDELHFSGVIFKVHKANERSIQTVILEIEKLEDGNKND